MMGDKAEDAPVAAVVVGFGLPELLICPGSVGFSFQLSSVKSFTVIVVVAWFG